MVRHSDQPAVNLADRRRFTIYRGGGSGVRPPAYKPGGGDGDQAAANSRVGVWLLLTSATIIFASLISAYLVRMDLADWRSVPLPGILWLNTGLLIIASIFWQSAVKAVRAGDRMTVLQRVQVAGVIAVLFVAGQLMAWQQMRLMGFPLGTGPASSFFYLITLIHGLHIIGGLVAWVLTLMRIRSTPSINMVATRIQLSALYWHFLLIVWLVMYGLMLAT